MPVANDPRAYRDEISSTPEAPRPDFEVLAVEPDDLDEVVLRLSSQVVVCDHVIAVVEDEAPSLDRTLP